MLAVAVVDVGTVIASVREPILSVGQFTGFRRNVE